MRLHVLRETETDPVLRTRFSSVSLIGRGQFSNVYVVADQKPTSQEFDNNSTRYAIKRRVMHIQVPRNVIGVSKKWRF